VNVAEARLAYGDRRAPLEEITEGLASSLQSRVVSITRGQHGSLVQGERGEPASVPSFTRDVVDPVGAGDAFLAVTAPLARAEVPADLIGFVGNAAAGLAVQVVGNSEPIDPLRLSQFVSTLLK
jgi:sugar/nucleoside kinase (ribokinase family)